MMKTTKSIISLVLLLLVVPLYSFGYNGSQLQFKGLFKLTPIETSSTANEVQFLYKQQGLSVYFSKDRISYVTQSIKDKDLVVGNRIDLIHEGSNANLTIKSSNEQQTKSTISVNGKLYKITTVDEVIFENLYANVDLKYFINNDGKLTYHYLLKENADLNSIKVKYNGAEKINLTQEGKLNIGNKAGSLTVSHPVTFEGDFENEVVSDFTLNNDNTLSFQIPDYTTEKSYVIDPIISYSTYFGGESSDMVEGIAADDTLNVYVVGHTLSNMIPDTAGAFQNSRAALKDAIVFKFDSLGNLRWFTYFGGTRDDEGLAISVSESGKVFIAGSTESLDLPGTFNSALSVGYAFVAVFENDGTFINSRYLGGASTDVATALVTVGDTVYVTGFTSSTDFPVSLLALPKSAGEDAFLVALNDTTGFIWGQFLGGNSGDKGRAIAKDFQNNIIIAGETDSPDFPLLLASQTSNNGLDDGFVAKYTVNGIRILSTYYGGSDLDIVNDIAIDSSNAIYLVGNTISTDLAFPATGITAQANNGGGLIDAFVLKMNQFGMPQWGTYFGGNESDNGLGIDVNLSGAVVITGRTNSDTLEVDSFALQSVKATEFDAFIAQYTTNGTKFYASYLGGNGNDFGKDVIYEPNQSTYILAGNTRSTDFPVAPIAHQPNNAGDNDIFLYTNCTLIPNNNISAEGLVTDTLRLCENEAVATIQGTTPLGGSGVYSFQFQVMNDSTTGFENIPGANGEDYILDTANLQLGINVFRRVVSDGFCRDTSNFAYVRLLDSPVADFVFDTLCAGNAIQFLDRTRLDGTDTIKDIAYSFGDMTGAVVKDPVKTYSAPGIYTVGLTVTAGNGCFDGQNRDVPVSANPTANFSFVTQCDNDAVQFTNTSTNVTIEEYTWSFGDGTTSTMEDPLKIYAGEGSYIVELVVGRLNGCTDTISKTVGLDSVITADFTTTNNTCVDSTVTFMDASQSFSGIVMWEWDFGNGTSSTVENPTVTYTASGSYDVELIVTSASGCIDTIVKSVVIGIPPSADFSTFQNCVDQSSQFTDESTTSSGIITQWFYDFGDGNSSGDQNPTNVYATAGPVNVTLSVVTEFGCLNSITKTIAIAAKPVVEAGNDVSIFEGSSAQLNATSATTGTYSWTPINGLNPPTISNPVASPSSTTLYTVRLTDADGCFGEDSLTVTVDPAFFIPTAFTPNGDGDNDDFVVAGINRFPNHSVIIFNRWGAELFSTEKNYGSIPWDGTYEGELLPIGAYYYIIDLGDGSKTFKGTITILR